MYQKHPKDEIEVVYALAGVNDSIRRTILPRLRKDFGISYTVLDDGRNHVAGLYRLKRDPRIPKTLIVDREGKVRFVGYFRSSEAGKIESALDAALKR